MLQTLFFMCLNYLSVFRCSKQRVSCRIVLIVVELVYLGLDPSIWRSFFFFGTTFPRIYIFSTWCTSAHPGWKCLTRTFFVGKTLLQLQNNVSEGAPGVFIAAGEQIWPRNGSVSTIFVLARKMVVFSDLGTKMDRSRKLLICTLRTFLIRIEDD